MIIIATAAVALLGVVAAAATATEWVVIRGWGGAGRGKSKAQPFVKPGTSISYDKDSYLKEFWYHFIDRQSFEHGQISV